jgi:DNA processing protein
MDFPIMELPSGEFPLLLKEIPDPPKQLNYRGNMIPQGTKCLAVVGSRNYTTYGKQVVDYLIGGLGSYPIAIISGLALGIDALAHEAALRARLYTVAVPGSGLDDDVLYPRKNRGLAHRILESGGGLLSEFEPMFNATAWSFPQRNRIMAGLAHAVLIIEATERSGTLITARLTAEYNRELLVVPGNIFSESAKGNHQFLKLGATPVTTPGDIIDALGIEEAQKETPAGDTKLTSEEQKILETLREPMERDEIIRILARPAGEIGVLLMKMELRGLIREQNDLFYKI